MYTMPQSLAGLDSPTGSNYHKQTHSEMVPKSTPFGDRSNLAAQPTFARPRQHKQPRSQLCEKQSNLHTTRSFSFHPLPSIPAGSMLQLPSFLDLSPSPPSPCDPSRSPEVKEFAFNVPASLHHVNSPYVPWSLSLRLEIMRPLTPDSFVFAECTVPAPRAHGTVEEVMLVDYSQHSEDLSSTMLPEAAFLPPPKKIAIKKGWTTLRRAVSMNVRAAQNGVKVVATKVKTVLNSKPAPVPEQESSKPIHEQTSPGSSSFPTFSDAELNDSPTSYPRRRRTMSSVSRLSTETTSLQTWLAERQQTWLAERQQNAERPRSPLASTPISRRSMLSSVPERTTLGTRARSFPVLPSSVDSQIRLSDISVEPSQDFVTPRTTRVSMPGIWNKFT